MTGIISTSRQTFDTRMKYKVKAPIEMIPTGVNVLHSAAEDTSIALREKLGLKPETPVVLSLGRVAFEKNLDDALSVFAEALEEVPDAMFIIVGGGPAMSALQEHVSALEIDDHVIFTGEVNHNDVYGYYKMGDVFVSASVSETQGLTFIEAMTADTPVVAIHSPYLDTIVTDENIGTLVDDSFGLLEPMVMYLKAKTTGETIGNPETRAAVLHEIDERTFGKRVIDFYAEALAVYHEEEDTEAAEANDVEYSKTFLLRNPFRRDD